MKRQADAEIEKAVALAQSGDADAFDAIVRRYQRPIRAWCIGRCPPGGDADDVAQNTFVQAFKRLNEYTLGTDFGAWLFTIARYQMMSECTRLRRLADYHNRYAPHALTEALQRRAEAESHEVDDRLVHLRECLAKLGAEHAAVLASRYREEEPIAVIAERTGRTANAIRKQLCVLRKNLHECIQSRMTAETTT